MLFLHGAGERGDNLDQVKKWGPPKRVGEKKDFPFVVISPQPGQGLVSFFKSRAVFNLSESQGDILCFLPGQEEIDNAVNILQSLAPEFVAISNISSSLQMI